METINNCFLHCLKENGDDLVDVNETAGGDETCLEIERKKTDNANSHVSGWTLWLTWKIRRTSLNNFSLLNWVFLPLDRKRSRRKVRSGRFDRI